MAHVPGHPRCHVTRGRAGIDQSDGLIIFFLVRSLYHIRRWRKAGTQEFYFYGQGIDTF